ncbi:MAG: hypothetical protein JXX29_19920 [Deltaproteobacteria bacterium]|nr:hypothetical protein [Deltaproteobacteria bacterium]MBN2673959.1 hypothetical protein [Deltaproteobacteria bacterium]
MNDQIKKQTNMGIVLAILGFALIGGALVLIPKLVDEKIATMGSGNRSDSDSATGTATAATTGTAAANRSSMPGTDTGGAGQNAVSAAADSDRIQNKAVAASPTGPWVLTLQDKFDPDDASAAQLKKIIELIKSDPNLRLGIVGMNNMKKSSKLAQMGANRIANIIVKEAAVVEERLDINFEQQTDMNGIAVKVSVLGGAQ